MTDEWSIYLKVVGLIAFVCLGYFRPRFLVRSLQAVGTATFSGFALYGLGMVLMGKANSVMGGLLFVGGCAALAVISFNLFGWIARSRYPE